MEITAYIELFAEIVMKLIDMIKGFVAGLQE